MVFFDRSETSGRFFIFAGQGRAIDSIFISNKMVLAVKR